MNFFMLSFSSVKRISIKDEKALKDVFLAPPLQGPRQSVDRFVNRSGLVLQDTSGGWGEEEGGEGRG